MFEDVAWKQLWLCKLMYDMHFLPLALSSFTCLLTSQSLYLPFVTTTGLANKLYTHFIVKLKNVHHCPSVISLVAASGSEPPLLFAKLSLVWFICFIDRDKHIQGEGLAFLCIVPMWRREPVEGVGGGYAAQYLFTEFPDLGWHGSHTQSAWKQPSSWSQCPCASHFTLLYHEAKIPRTRGDFNFPAPEHISANLRYWANCHLRLNQLVWVSVNTVLLSHESEHDYIWQHRHNFHKHFLEAHSLWACVD